jgi:hypothetical protein
MCISISICIYTRTNIFPSTLSFLPVITSTVSSVHQLNLHIDVCVCSCGRRELVDAWAARLLQNLQLKGTRKKVGKGGREEI